MKTIHDWLNAKHLNESYSEGLTRESFCIENPLAPVLNLHVFAALVAINGSFRVTGWGTSSGGGLYGHQGVDMQGALDLLGMSAYCTGLLDAHGESAEVLANIVMQEHTRVHDILSKRAAPPNIIMPA